MSLDTNDTPSPLTLTNAAIAAIEQAASAMFGLRLRHVPDEPIEPSTPTKPTTRAATKPAKPEPKKAPTKPTKPASEAEIRRQVRLACRKKEGVSSAELADLIPRTPEQRTAFLNRMIRDGILRKEGVSKATRYHLASKKADEEGGGEG